MGWHAADKASVGTVDTARNCVVLYAVLSPGWCHRCCDYTLARTFRNQISRNCSDTCQLMYSLMYFLRLRPCTPFLDGASVLGKSLWLLMYRTRFVRWRI